MRWDGVDGRVDGWVGRRNERVGEWSEWVGECVGKRLDTRVGGQKMLIN